MTAVLEPLVVVASKVAGLEPSVVVVDHLIASFLLVQLIVGACNCI